MTTIVFNHKRIATDCKFLVNNTAPLYSSGKILSVSNLSDQIFHLSYSGQQTVGTTVCSALIDYIEKNKDNEFNIPQLKCILSDFIKQFEFLNTQIIILCPTGQCVLLQWKYKKGTSYYELDISTYSTLALSLVYGSGSSAIPSAILKIRHLLTVEEIAWLCAKYDSGSAPPIYYKNVNSDKLLTYKAPKPARLAKIKELLTDCLN